MTQCCFQNESVQRRQAERRRIPMHWDEPSSAIGACAVVAKIKNFDEGENAPKLRVLRDRRALDAAGRSRRESRAVEVSPEIIPGVPPI
jgi:hypothetical protein